jgi:integrase
LLYKLRIHREQQLLLKASAVDFWKENDLIFPSCFGTMEDPNNLHKDFRNKLDRTGLTKICFHDLRHTVPSIMLNRGVPIIVVSKRFGHANPSGKMNLYGHLYMESRDEPARIMDEILRLLMVTLPKPKAAETLGSDC